MVLKVQVEVPRTISKPALDRRLAKGWFRSGSVLFRAPLLHVDQELRELVHLRVRLESPPNSKSRRRLLKRNRERFRTVIGPARIDDERRRLYRLTLPRFVGFVVTDLEQVALGALPGVFDTREVRVYDGDKLVALSYFDLGHRSAASILGLHDPAYKKHGLGIYTMLEEMAFAREQGARWYYPGYTVPGVSGFDYKHRLGHVQYFDGDARWRRRAQPPVESDAVEYANDRMRALEAAIAGQGLDYERKIYPAFWLGRLPEADAPYLRAMWHVRCGPTADDGAFMVAEYVTDDDVFVVSRVAPITLMDLFDQMEPNPELQALCESRLLAYRNTVSIDQRAADAAFALAAGVYSGAHDAEA